MRFSDILADNLITINLEAENSAEAIEELVDLLIAEHEISLRNRDEILNVVNQREQSVSTGIGSGVALPHGTVDCIPDIIAAMGISKRGVDFKAIDGEPVYIVILLLVPKALISRHIKTMAQVARIFHRDEVRSAIRAASSPEQIFRFIRECDQGQDN
jgi:mannitol/fructose-specific phosphotransferase system IIA component (Ntr-type)